MIGLLYRVLTDLGSPLIHLYLHRRMARGKEDAARFQERLGYAAEARPAGRLLWCHAASVGESVSLLAVIEGIRVQYPHWAVLVTTGTVTSARLMRDRLPSGVIHQYVPVDRMPYVQRFLRHWKPDLVIWVESELWPNLLTVVRRLGIKAILLNGRMSEKSCRSWLYLRGWIGSLLRGFTMILAQTEEDRVRFHRLGGANTSVMGNLKYASAPLPCDKDELCRVQAMIAARPVWLMASSHEGEEILAACAHESLVKTFPDVLTVIVPRHPVRGAVIAQQLRERGIAVARRSQGDPIAEGTQIYVADTLGELGLFYRVCPTIVMGGSFVPVGGHNPIEPAQLGCAIVLGPHMFNFAEISDAFLSGGAARLAQDEGELVRVVSAFLYDKAQRDAIASRAVALLSERNKVLDHVLSVLSPFLRGAR